MKIQFLGPSRGGGGRGLLKTPFGPSFPCFPTFFLPFFVFFLAFYIFIFVHFFICEKCFPFSFFIFSEEKVSSFLFSCISFKYFLMLALVSEFNCFLRSRCSMEMWCPDDIGRDSWDWVGPPAWGESMLQLPRVGWRLLACLKRSLPRLYYGCCCFRRGLK